MADKPYGASAAAFWPLLVGRGKKSRVRSYRRREMGSKPEMIWGLRREHRDPRGLEGLDRGLRCSRSGCGKCRACGEGPV